MATLQRLLDLVDLARITGEPVSVHRRRLRLGTGPRPLRLGNQFRFLPDDVLEWLESQGPRRSNYAENKKPTGCCQQPEASTTDLHSHNTEK